MRSTVENRGELCTDILRCRGGTIFRHALCTGYAYTVNERWVPSRSHVHTWHVAGSGKETAGPETEAAALRAGAQGILQQRLRIRSQAGEAFCRAAATTASAMTERSVEGFSGQFAEVRLEAACPARALRQAGESCHAPVFERCPGVNTDDASPGECCKSQPRTPGAVRMWKSAGYGMLDDPASDVSGCLAQRQEQSWCTAASDRGDACML